MNGFFLVFAEFEIHMLAVLVSKRQCFGDV